MVSIVSTPTRELRVADIHPSPLNPRKKFPEESLKQLAASLKDVGQLEACTVRPDPAQPGRFELVNGERRFRAAQLAGLDVLVCKVCEMSDADALVMMLTTGGSGTVEQLDPFDEAGGFHRLMEIEKATFEQVAKRVSKSLFYVQLRLGLLNLPTALKEAVEKDKIAMTTVWEVARIPGEAKRAEVAQLVLTGGMGGMPMTTVEARTHITKKICRSLRSAPFEIDDAALLPSAGACARKSGNHIFGICPYRTGSETRDTYGDVTPHTCMNPTCYEAKVAAARARVLAKAATPEKPALPAEVVAEVFPAGEKGISPRADYVAFTQPIPRDMLKPEVTKAPTWASLCGEAGVKVYVGIDQDGRAVDVARIGEAIAGVPLAEAAIFTDEVVRRHGLARPARGGGITIAAGAGKSFADREREEQDLREKAERKAKQRLKKARTWLDELATGLEGMAVAGKPAWLTWDYWSLMFERMLHALGDEDVAFVCELYGIDGEIEGEHTARKALTEFVARISKERCGALVTAMTLAPWLRAEGPDAKFVTEWHDQFVKLQPEEPAASEDPAGVDLSELDLQVRHRHNEGKTSAEIAQVLGVSLPAVHSAKKRLGLVKPREAGKPAAAEPTISTEESAKLAQLVKAHAAGMSPQRLASEFAMPLADVCGALQLDLRNVRNVVTQLRQDAEEGFVAAKIMTPGLRNRVVKTATSNRVQEFAGLDWPEDFRRLLEMLSQRKPAEAAPAAAKEGDE